MKPAFVMFPVVLAGLLAMTSCDAAAYHESGNHLAAVQPAAVQLGVQRGGRLVEVSAAQYQPVLSTDAPEPPEPPGSP